MIPCEELEKVVCCDTHVLRKAFPSEVQATAVSVTARDSRVTRRNKMSKTGLPLLLSLRTSSRLSRSLVAFLFFVACRPSPEPKMLLLRETMNKETTTSSWLAGRMEIPHILSQHPVRVKLPPKAWIEHRVGHAKPNKRARVRE